MADAAVFPGPDRVLDPGLDPVRGVDIGVLAQPAFGAAGRFVAHRLYRQPSPASNKVSWAPGWGRSRRAKTRIAAGQARSWSPPGPSRSSPVSSVTCASSIQHARCAQAASRRRHRRGARGPRRGHRSRPARPAPGPSAAPSSPARSAPTRPSRSAHSRGGPPAFQVLDQGVAGPGAVAGDHQLPPELRRERGDRRVGDGQVVRGGIRPGRAAAQHPGQRR